MGTQAQFTEAALGSTETTETDLGSIVVPTQGVRGIVAVWGIITIQTQTVAEGVAGFFRLAFKSLPGTYRFPVVIFGGATGTVVSGQVTSIPSLIPVNIPVPPNETVDIYAALNLAQTGTCRGMAGLIFE